MVDAGTEYVSSGGVASGTIVSGGTQAVLSGGIASAAVVAGGTEAVSSGGIASGTTVSAGALVVSAGGLATDVAQAGGLIVNSGVISASTASGTALSGSVGSATVINVGNITGGVGVALDAGGVVLDAGTITGTSGTAISFGGTNSNTLAITTDGIISGTVSATSSASNTLELMSGTAASGVLSGFGTNYVGFQSLQVDAGGTWELPGTATLGSGVAVRNEGTILVGSGDHLAIDGALGPVLNGGMVAVKTGGTLALDGVVSAGEDVLLAGSGVTVSLTDPAGFGGTIGSLARGDTIDLSTLALSATSASIVGGTIVVSSGGSTDTLNLNAAPAAHTTLALTADGQGGTDVRLVPMVTEALTSDTGASNSDGITSNPSLTGTADANSTVVLTEGATVLGSATADNSGGWTFAPTGLVDGGHTVTATETDAGGNVGSAVLSFTLQATPPAAPTALSLDSSTDTGVAGDDITNVASPVIDGHGGADGDIISLYDGNVLIGSGTVSSGAWSVSPTTPLSVGSNVLSATETDVAGNVSVPSGGLTVTLDTTIPPAPTGLALTSASDTGVPHDDLTNTNTPVVTGSGAVNGDTITLYDGGTSVGSEVVSGGQWSVTASALSDGGHALTAKETEVAGNVSLASTALNVTIDTVPPAPPTSVSLDPASDSGVAGDGITDDTVPTIDGHGSANGDGIALYDGANLLGAATVTGGAWSVALTNPLNDGPHNLTARESDPAGNVSPASTPFVLTIETNPPPTPGTPGLALASDSGVPGDGITNHTLPVITGSSTGSNGDTVAVYNGSTLLGSGTVQSGAWTVSAGSPLAEGVHHLTAKETNAAGVASSQSPAFTLTIDTTAPAAPTGLTLAASSDTGTQGDLITSITTPVISGIGTSGDTVALYDGNQLVGAATIAGGAWSITTSTLSSGGHVLHATETDVAGNVSTPSGTLGVTIDIVPPPSTPALAAGSDSGALGDGITNHAAPVLTGTGSSGDTVTLYDGGTAIGSATVSSGAWSITAPTLIDGGHALTATETDVAGNTSTPTSAFSLTIDTLAPSAPSIPALAAGSDSGAPGDGITNHAAPVLTGTGVSGDTVTLYDGATRSAPPRSAAAPGRSPRPRSSTAATRSPRPRRTWRATPPHPPARSA